MRSPSTFVALGSSSVRRNGRQLPWRAYSWAVAVVPLALFVVSAWRLRWMSDDGYIHLRVVQNMLDGHGLVYNASERIEASTSPLWVGTLTVLSSVVPLSLPWIAVLAGLVFSVVGLVAGYGAALRLAATGRPDPASQRIVVLPLGLLVIVAMSPFREFATSGLETSLVFAWLGVCCWWCAHRVTMSNLPSRWIDVAGAALVGLGWVIRPDLAVFSAAFGCVILLALRGQHWRHWLAVVGALMALPFAYQVFRMGYYAMLLPNTALVKEAGTPQWGLGWAYLVDLLRVHRLWLPLGLLLGVVGVAARTDLSQRKLLVAVARVAPIAAGLVHAIYIIRAGGDFMHARLLLPAVFAIAAPVGLTIPWRLDVARYRKHVALVAVPAVVVLWILMGVVRPPSPTPSDQVVHERRYYRDHWGVDQLVEPTSYFDIYQKRRPASGKVNLARNGNPEAAVTLRQGVPYRAAGVVQNAGANGFAWERDIYAIDYYSLAHPIGGHLRGLSGRIGHQKALPLEWRAAEFTGSEGGLLGDIAVPGANAEGLAAARRAVECGAVDRYLYDIRAPLTPARFISNIKHSLSNTTFRIPRDPIVAERELCGADD